jgi:hypothetical protein
MCNNFACVCLPRRSLQLSDERANFLKIWYGCYVNTGHPKVVIYAG